MMFTLRGGRPGRLQKPAAALCSLAAACALALTGPGAAAQLKVGQPISFGSSAVGTPVTIQAVLSATGTTTVSSARVLTNGATGQDFTQIANTCMGTFQQGSSCSVTLAFTPKQIGIRHGVMLLYGSSNQVVSTVFLNGIGLGASFAFAPANVTDLASAPGLTPSTFTAGSAIQDGNGNLYFTDVQNQRVLMQNATTTAISLVASLPVSASSSIAIGPDGTLFVSAQSSVYAFLPGATPTAISTGTVTLVSPTGLAVDSIGDLFIADASTGKIVEYSLETNTSSLINLSLLGSSGLSSPHGLALDAANNLYIADSGNDRIVEVSTGDSAISLLALNGLTLNDPTGIAVDPAGTVYVDDTGNSRLVELTVNGVDFVLTGTGLSLTTPTGVLIKPSGDLLMSDQVLGLVSVLRSTPKVNFPTPTLVNSLDTADGAMTLSVQATGNSVAQLVYPSSGSEPLISSAAFNLTSAGTCPYVTESANYTPEQFAIGAICTYTVDFTPTAVGLNSANLEIDTSLPGGSTTFTQLVPLAGQGLSTIVAFSLVASPSSTTVGSADSLTLTALNSANNPAKDYVGTVTFTTTDATGVFLGGTTYTFTAADAGVLTIPASAGIQFNQAGVFTVHATDGTYAATSNPVTVLYATRVSGFTSSVDPTLINQQTTLTATVSAISGAAPSGTVSFYSGTTLLGTATLNGGVATLPVSFAAAGTYALTAVYNGDATHASSTSAQLGQVVLNATTVTSFTSSVNPSLPGQTTTLTIALASTGPVPTGTVSFYSGATLLGTATLNGGVASLPASFAAAGAYGLLAIYSGDGNDATVSATLTQLVAAPVTISLTSSVNPSLVNQQVTLTVAVNSPSTSANSTPTGTVQIYDGTTLLGTVNLSGGGAALAATFTTAGVHTLTAVYSGDANHVGATSAGYPQDVVTATVAANFTSSVDPALVGQSTTLSVSLTATGSAPPTGTVSFYSGTTLLGTSTVSAGQASISTSFPAAGAYSLTAVYSGDANNGTATAGPLTQVVVAVGSVVLTSSVNPSLVGQNTTLTAFLGSTTATGTVSFYDGSRLLGTGNVSAGQASITVSFTTVGVHTLTAAYSGDSNNTASTSAGLAQDVLTATTAASFTSSVNPSLVGQDTILTLTLASTGGSPTPTGTVKFYNGAALLGTGNVSAGQATLTVSFATLGSYPLTAVYSGDNNNATVTAGPLAQVVVASGSVVLTSSINPSTVAQTTTLTAYVGSTTATGTISFYDGTTLLGTSGVSGGSATLPTSFTTAGIHSLTAVYSGDANDAKATSAVYSQDVVNSTTAASFTSSINPSLVGQSTTLAVTLTSLSASITGTVKFYDGTTLLGTATVSAGAASLPVTFSTAGTHQLTAVYSGDNNNAAVTAGPLAQVVINSTTITLASSVNPTLVSQSTTLTATLGSSLATGTISFYDGTTLLGTSGVSSGSATLPASFSTPGIHSLTAVYSGDANDAKATSAVYSQDVQNPDTTSLGAPAGPLAVGQSVTLTATIQSTAPGGAGSATGTVQFYDNGLLIGTGTVRGGVAMLTTSFSTGGTQSLTCQYSGDSYFAASACAAFSETVQDPSSLKLTSSLNPSVFTQSVTFTATVVTAGPTPTGTVGFYNGSALLATVTLSAGSNTVTYTTSTLPIGTDTIKASYLGDNNTAPAAATLAQVVLNPATIVFNCPTGIVLVNTPVSLTATVSSTGPAPTGTVKFMDGSTLLGTGTLSAGTATISATFSTIGTQTLTAIYSGDSNDGTVTSTTCTVQVVDAATISLTSSLNPSVVKQSVTLTATVTSSGPTPTGTVRFLSGTTLLGTVTVSGGVAALPYTFTTAGTYSITAVYSGDTNTEPVTSSALSQVVLNLASLTLTSATNPILLDNQDLLTVTVTSTGPTPTGLVTFFDGTAPLGNATLVNGTASLTVSFPVTGAQALTVQYYGDAVTAPATSAAITETVGDISVAVAAGTPSSASVLAGGTATYSLVLTPLIISTLPSAVSFSVSGLPTGATATFAPASAAAGSGVTPFTLTINAPAILVQQRSAPARSNRLAPITAALLLLPLAFAGRRRLAAMRRSLGALLLLLLAAAATSALTGCTTSPSSGYYGQTVQTYNLTVTAKSGQLSRTTGLTLTVQ